jgi:hypothetical protein
MPEMSEVAREIKNEAFPWMSMTGAHTSRVPCSILPVDSKSRSVFLRAKRLDAWGKPARDHSLPLIIAQNGGRPWETVKSPISSATESG